MNKIISDLSTGETTQVALTEAELAEVSQAKAKQDAENIELAKTQYQRNRASEYPPIGDQLDALWKGGDAATTMLAQVQAVKAKYPKPTE